MATKSYSNLKNSSSIWNSTLRNFGIVTVMNAKVYDIIEGMLVSDYQTKTGVTIEYLTGINPAWVSGSAVVEGAVIDFSQLKANEIISLYLNLTPVTTLKYLKTSNATQDGPKKTITGGQNSATLVKYGKNARLEMTNALGNAEALEALSGMTVEYFRSTKHTDATLKKGATDVLHATTTFAGPKAIIGDTFLVDAETQNQALAYILFYEFLPDGFSNLTQDADGDATVFDMNGDLKDVRILIGDDEATGDEDGVVVNTFYSILPRANYETNAVSAIEDKGLND
jgi:hypothetical protein